VNRRMSTRMSVGMAASLSLITLSLMGCSVAPTTNVPTGKPETNSSTGNLVATTKIGTTKSTKNIALAVNPITILYAGTKYNLPVPAEDIGKDTNVSAVVVPGGILFITPADFPDALAHPISEASIWFTPGQSSRGTQSLWMGATHLGSFAITQGGTPQLVGATQGYAIISAPTGAAQDKILAMELPTGQSTSPNSMRTIATLPTGALTGYGRGVYVWLDTQSLIHVVKLSSGSAQVIKLPVPSASGSGSTSSASDYPPQVVSGGVKVGNQIVPVALIRQSPPMNLPPGYPWITVGQSNSPQIAVPRAWSVVKQMPGGSSIGVVASNPQDPGEKVTLWINACVGCYSPSGPSGTANTPDSPLLSVQTGETYTWLNDQTVAYTLPPNKNSAYPTYGLTRTFTSYGGDEEATITAPPSDKQTATLILNSILVAP